MTAFANGPASGVSLVLRRAPRFIRAARAKDGGWDALDQVSDKPDDNEELFAYEGNPDEVLDFHLCGARVGSGWFQARVYMLVEEQPDDATMRSNDLWQKWCWQQSQFGGSNG